MLHGLFRTSADRSTVSGQTLNILNPSKINRVVDKQTTRFSQMRCTARIVLLRKVKNRLDEAWTTTGTTRSLTLILQTRIIYNSRWDHDRVKRRWTKSKQNYMTTTDIHLEGSIYSKLRKFQRKLSCKSFGSAVPHYLKCSQREPIWIQMDDIVESRISAAMDMRNAYIYMV